MQKRQFLCTGEFSTFSTFRTGSFLYVDKTEYLYRMILPEKGCYFLSRPRRFGKTLTVSTLKAIFQGKRELFNGLYIGNTDYDWKTYPVIHLTMNAMDTTSLEDMKKSIADYLKDYAEEQFEIELNLEQPQNMFRKLITTLGEKNQVVVLIDEYDKPLLDHIGDPEFPKYLEFFKSFYGIVKACIDYERFVFITGASKFSHVSLFSDLNNLMDISHNSEYATMLGYTQEELEAHFGDRIEEIASSKNMTVPDLKEKIRKWYNGFHFEENAPTVYNPVSIAQFFSNSGKFSNYWFSTGTPTYLFKTLQADRFTLMNDLEKKVYSSDVFDAWEPGRIASASLFLQAGYLTIKEPAECMGEPGFTIGFPNYEVEQSFRKAFIKVFAATSGGVSYVQAMYEDMVNQNPEQLATDTESFFSGVSYEDHHKDEYVFKAIFANMFKFIGLNVHTEEHTIKGRMDAVVQMPCAVYIFEFKLQGRGNALQQIKEKGYHVKYLASRLPVYIIGCTFNPDDCSMTNWQYEQVDQSQL